MTASLCIAPPLISKNLELAKRPVLITGQNELRISVARLDRSGLTWREGQSRHTIRLELSLRQRLGN